MTNRRPAGARCSRFVLRARPGLQSRSAGFGLAGLALLAAGCGAESAPVARVSVPRPEVSLAYGRPVAVETSWEMVGAGPPAGGAPQVFVHLWGPGGELERTFDHTLPFAWQAGVTRSHSIELWQSLQDPPLAPGSYSLSLGVYDPTTRERWPLSVGGDDSPRREYRLARAEVPAGSADTPRLEFGAGWLAPETSADRQVLVHRWLADRGSLRIPNLMAAVDLDLWLTLPRLAEAQHRLSYEEGASTPRLSVTSACLAAPAVVEGFGAHRLRLALRPPADANGGGAPGCGIEIDANFTYLDLQHLVRRSADLGVVLWQPA